MRRWTHYQLWTAGAVVATAITLAFLTDTPAIAGRFDTQSVSGGGSGSGGGGGGGHGGGHGGSGSSGSGSSDSGSSGSGSGSWSGSGSSDSSGFGSSGSGSWGSGSSSGWSGSGDTLSALDDDSGSSSSDDRSVRSNSGSGSSNSGSGSSNSGSGSSDDESDSSNSGSGSSDDNSESSNSGSTSSRDDVQSPQSDYAWRNLAAREHPDYDRQGFPVRRGEIIAIDLTEAQVDAVELQGFKVIGRTKLPGLAMILFRLRIPKDLPLSQAMDKLRISDAASSAELDHYFAVTSGRVDLTADAPMMDMKVPKKQKLWIGIIDTAVWTGATLRDVRIEGRDFMKAKGGSHKPPFAHGTAVASILARQGAVRLTVANVFAADRHPYSSAEAIARAVNWMVERKVPVINISIAGPRNALLDRVIAAAAARGHIVVAAAGNEGPAAPPTYPAASPGALAVTAIDQTGRVYPKANRGAHIEIAAFGVGIGAEAPDGTLKPHSGTSFAAPFVSASLARCLPSPDAALSGGCVRAMEARARDLGAPGRDPVYGYGLLNP